MGHKATAIFVDRDEIADAEWDYVVKRGKTYPEIALVSLTSIKNATFSTEGDLTRIEVPLYWCKSIKAKTYSLEYRGWKIIWDTGHSAFFYGNKTDSKFWKEK